MFEMQQFMFFIVLIGIVNIDIISAKSADENAMEEKLLQTRNKCIKSVNLSDDLAKLIFDHKLFTPDTTVASTPKPLQCYCLCYLREMELFIDDKPNEQFLRQTLPVMINDQKKATAVLDKCMKLEDADKCTLGFEFELCLIKETGLYIY